MKNLKKNGGITLVALVITIIILLILAGISIQAITNTGIFAQANNAKRESEIANIKEQIVLDIYEKQLVPPLGSITDEQLETILGKYGTVNKEDGTIVGITTGKGYEILLKDIYGGETVAESVPESVPDGAIVTPVNDITTWLKTGEISKQYSYTTIEEVIADSTCIQSLMNNENAMKYLARSTEFADAICASETTMTSLGKSAYVDDTVLNSDNWVNKISSSNYYELVYSPITVHSSASTTIYFNDKTFTSDASGNTTKVIPWGTFTFSDSVSGQSFERKIDKDTTDLYVMPTGALYWYGNECTWLTGGWKYTTVWKPDSPWSYGEVRFDSELLSSCSGKASIIGSYSLPSNLDAPGFTFSTDSDSLTLKRVTENSSIHELNAGEVNSVSISMWCGPAYGTSFTQNIEKQTNALYLYQNYMSGSYVGKAWVNAIWVE